MACVNISTSMEEVFPSDQLNTSNTQEMCTVNVKTGFELSIEFMNKYILPLIMLAGLIGNTMSFVVFRYTYLRHQSSSIYLAFLNMVDNVFLVSLGVGVWFGWIRVYIMHRQVLCQLIVYLTYELTTNAKTSTNVETWNILLTNVKNH